MLCFEEATFLSVERFQMDVSNLAHMFNCVVEADGKLDAVNAKVSHHQKGVKVSQWSPLTNQTDNVVVPFG